MNTKLIFPYSIKEIINKDKSSQISYNIFEINKEKNGLLYLFKYFIFLILFLKILSSYQYNITITVKN